MARLSFTQRFINKFCCGGITLPRKNLVYKSLILILTFFVYCSYHMSRKPISVVKNVLDQNCTDMEVPAGVNDTVDPHWCDWKPFDGEDSRTLLGIVDSAFLFSYAFSIFFSGAIAERMDLRIFLGSGMILSGCFCIIFGLGYTYKIHHLWYFVLAQIFGGMAQSTGWPGVVASVGNWYGKSSRGLIFGIWNSHTSIGNILGTVIAAAFVDQAWSLSFIVPGCIIGSLGIIVLFFLVPEPGLLGLPDPNLTDEVSSTASEASIYHIQNEKDAGKEKSYIDKEKEAEVSQKEEKAITVLGAMKIPGVLEFAWCLFFAKLVSYTFLYWLPNYIKYSTSFGPSQSANLSTLFDVGGIMGGIFAGVMKDLTKKPATVCVCMLLVCAPTMFIYYTFGDSTFGLNVFLLIVVGMLVNGPYALITTAVSADLGTHKCLRGNTKALATVSAIIDGTGSIGAAVGPLLAGAISEINWGYVFYMLMASDVCAMLLLLRLVHHELEPVFRSRRIKSNSVI